MSPEGVSSSHVDSERFLTAYFFFPVCPHGKFKSETGDGQCESCPEHSKASDYGLTECRCNNGYYRAKKDPKNMACTRKYCFKLKIVFRLNI